MHKAIASDMLVAKLIHAAPIGIAILDLDMRFIEINEPLAMMNGIPASAHIGKTVAEIVPELYSHVRPMFEAVIRAGAEPVHFELSGETPSQPGVTRHWKETWFQIRLEGVLRAMGVFVDEVTEEKRNREELAQLQASARQRMEEMQAIMEAAPAAIWIAQDRECRTITGNQESYAMLHLPRVNVSASGDPNERTRRGFQEYRDGKPIPAEELPMQRAAATGKAIRNAELSLVFDNGEVRHIYGNTAPLLGRDGAVRGAVAVFIDVTERKKAEEALRAADQRKNEFIATLAHELRNPLSPIRNAAAILRSNPDLATQETAVGMVERQIAHMARLLDDLLDVARITNNKMTLHKAPVLLRLMLEDALEATQPLIEAQRHLLTVEGDKQPLKVLGDPVRLTQIFVNLLTNAAKYTPAGGRIAVTVRQEGAMAVVEVRDNGIGIAADQTDFLFELFARVAPAMNEAEGGLGIGLSLVKLFAEAHGGAVTAASAGLGRGSTFTVRLPLIAAEEPLEEPRVRPLKDHASAERQVVLVVDDNVDSAESLAILLRMEGHEVHVAYDGQRAVELACIVRPRVVCLDLGIPRIDGYEVCRRIKASLQPKPPRIIAVTGWGATEDRLQTKRAGFDLHLTKPVDIPVLLASLLS